MHLFRSSTCNADRRYILTRDQQLIPNPNFPRVQSTLAPRQTPTIDVRALTTAQPQITVGGERGSLKKRELIFQLFCWTFFFIEKLLFLIAHIFFIIQVVSNHTFFTFDPTIVAQAMDFLDVFKPNPVNFVLTIVIDFVKPLFNDIFN